jgi:hypothetical protein
MRRPSPLWVAIAFSFIGCGGALEAGAVDESELKRTGVAATVTLVMVHDANGDGTPNWGDTVSFAVSSYSDQVQLTCAQNGTLVLGAAGCSTAQDCPSSPYWPWNDLYPLSSASWTAGAADCTAVAQLFAGRKLTTIASLSFVANP